MWQKWLADKHTWQSARRRIPYKQRVDGPVGTPPARIWRYEEGSCSGLYRSKLLKTDLRSKKGSQKEMKQMKQRGRTKLDTGREIPNIETNLSQAYGRRDRNSIM